MILLYFSDDNRVHTGSLSQLVESRFLFTDFNAHKVILLELSKIIEDHSALLCHLAVNQASALTQSTLSHSIGDPQLYGSQSTQNASNINQQCQTKSYQLVMPT